MKYVAINIPEEELIKFGIRLLDEDGQYDDFEFTDPFLTVNEATKEVRVRYTLV